MVLEIINQMSKNQKSSLIVWNTVHLKQWLLYIYITVKTLRLLQPYFGPLSCMPVVYVTREASNLNQSPFSVVEREASPFFLLNWDLLAESLAI